MAVIGIVPAAGFATRLGAIESSKEVIPLGDRVLMDVLLDRLAEAPCDEVRVVTRPDKTDVAARAAARGATIVHGTPPTVAQSICLGLGGLDDDDIWCFGWPDCLWEPPDGFVTLVAAVEAGEEIALGLFRTNEPERYDPVVLADPDARAGRVERIEVKPEVASSVFTWGCAAGRVSALRPLEDERDPGEYFAARCPDGIVHGHWLSDTFIDLGTWPSLLEAQRAGGTPESALFTPKPMEASPRP
jgi:NDP-sugar pyrophosphorylase family protein